MTGWPEGLRVRLCGDAGPYPERFVAGRVSVEPGGPVWRPRRRPVPAVPLAGSTPVDLPGGRTRRALLPYEHAVAIRAADGAVLTLAATDRTLLRLKQLLAAAPEPAGPPVAGRRPARVTPLAVLLLTGAAGAGAVALWARDDGIPVDAAVLAREGASCRIEWSDPASGARHQDEVRCSADAAAAGRIRVLVDEDDRAGSPQGPARGVVALAAGLGAAGAAAVVVRTLPPRGLGRPRAHGAVPAAAVDVPALGDPPSYAAASAVLSARAAAEGWAPRAAVVAPAAGLPRRWWRVPALRAYAGTYGYAAVPTVLLLGAVVAAGLGSWVTVWTLATGEDRTIYARVVDVDRSRPPWLTYDVRVHFHPGGRQLYATVAMTREPAVDERVSIIYSRDHTGRARVDEAGDGLTRKAAVTGAAAVLLGGLLAAEVALPILRVRRLWRARAGPAKAWRYVRYVEPGGAAGMLLWSRYGDGGPEAVVRLAADPAVLALPVAGEAQVHGEVAGRKDVVPVVGGHTCWPLGRAREVAPGAARALVEGPC